MLWENRRQKKGTMNNEQGKNFATLLGAVPLRPCLRQSAYRRTRATLHGPKKRVTPRRSLPQVRHRATLWLETWGSAPRSSSYFSPTPVEGWGEAHSGVKIRCMSIPNTAARTVRPTHPGEMLREDFLPEYGLTPTLLANAVGVSRQTINELLHERRALSPEMALRLGRFFGNSPEFWLNAQRAVDLWEASRSLKREVARIQPVKTV